MKSQTGAEMAVKHFEKVNLDTLGVTAMLIIHSRGGVIFPDPFPASECDFNSTRTARPKSAFTLLLVDTTLSRLDSIDLFIPKGLFRYLGPSLQL